MQWACLQRHQRHRMARAHSRLRGSRKE
jgi:hypothetical protein